MNRIAKCLGTSALAATLASLFTAHTFAALPFVSDDAGTLGKGTSQVELWYQGSSDRETVAGSEVKTSGNQPGATIGHGVGEHLDLEVGFTRAWGKVAVDGARSNDAGSADITLNAKWRFYEKREFYLAVKPQVGYSYNVGGTGNDHTTSYGGWLIATKEHEALAVSLNAGYFYNDYGSASERNTGRSGIWSITALATYGVIEGLTFGLDVGASTNPYHSSGVMPAYALVGAIYSVNRNVDLSLGVQFGITEPEPDFTGTVGITFRF